MELERISTNGFRNLSPEPFTLPPGLNLILGANGQGKSNLLEAVFLLGNLRSFRTPHLRHVPTLGRRTFSVSGVVASARGAVTLEQHVVIDPAVHRELSIDGRPASTTAYLQVLPVFCLWGGDGELISGGPKTRRSLLDRLAFLATPAYLGELRSYRKALRQRNAALTRRESDGALAAWERTLAAAAANVVVRRRETVAILAREFAPAYETLRGDNFPDLSIAYRCDASVKGETAEELAAAYQKRYHTARASDREAGYTVAGPHRHDLQIHTAGRGVRGYLSAGQGRLAAAAIRLAALAEVERRRGELLPVLVDDADAELDAEALERLLNHLGNERQLLVAGAHAGVTGGHLGAARLWMRRGRVLRESQLGEKG